MREEFVFTWKKMKCREQRSNLFLVDISVLFVFFSFSIFFMCMCTGGAYLTAFVHIRTHVRGVVIHVSYVFLHRHKLNGNLPAWLSTIVCWVKISEAKPALANSDITANQFSARIPCPALPPNTGVICKLSKQHSQYFLGSRLHSSNFYDIQFNLSIETIIQS